MVLMFKLLQPAGNNPSLTHRVDEAMMRMAVNSTTICVYDPSTKLEPEAYDDGNSHPNFVTHHLHPSDVHALSVDPCVSAPAYEYTIATDETSSTTTSTPTNMGIASVEDAIMTESKPHMHTFKKMTITTEKPFQCAICEKQFRQLSTLTNHFKIHTGEKPFKCTICNKKFRQSSTLTNHAKIHTGEKPFNCNYCGKVFRQLSTLTNHQKIHTGEKPFECVVCKKQFRQSSTLNNHIKIHVSDKPFMQEIQDLHDQQMEQQKHMLDQRQDGQHLDDDRRHQQQPQHLVVVAHMDTLGNLKTEPESST